MKSLIVLMSVMAASLAATSLYLLKQLGAERELAQQLAQEAVVLRASAKAAIHPQPTPRATATAAPTASVQPGAAAAAPDAAPSGPVPQAQNDSYARRRQMMSEPSSRALLRADRIAYYKAQNPGLARQLKLSDAEYQKLIEFLADQDLQRDVAIAKNHMGLPGNAYFDVQQRERRELTEQLGEERAKQFSAYQAGAIDRAQVRTLRSRLGELDVLTDEQATTLAAALQEEREQFNKDLQAQYGDRASYTLVTSGVNLIGTGSTADEDAMEQQLRDEMDGYSRRMRDRAASVLTCGQMKVFNEMQDAQLATQRVMVRTLRETVPQPKVLR